MAFLQGEIFGDDMKVSGAILDGWGHGIMPLEVERAVKTKMRSVGFTQDDLAARVGLAAVLRLPVGPCLGVYFPTGIGLLRGHEPRLVPWAWA